MVIAISGCGFVCSEIMDLKLDINFELQLLNNFDSRLLLDNSN